MRISKKAYYGLRAMALLAHNQGLSVHELARGEDMPEEYLHKTLQSLRRAGLVTALKGNTGGYTLAKSPEVISVWDIVSALDGGFKNFAPPKLTRVSPYPKLTHCQTNQIWRTLEQSIEATLSSITLATLVHTSHHTSSVPLPPVPPLPR